MSKKAAESHKKPAEHHTQAAKHHTEAAKHHDATPGQIALAWLLHRSPVMLPIPGTGSIDHLKENVAAAELTLDDDEIAKIDAATQTKS